MKIDFTQTLKNIDGTEAKDGDRTVNLGDIAIRSLNDLRINDEKTIVERGRLIQKLNANGELDITVDEAKLIQDTVKKLWSAFIVVQVIDILDKGSSD